MNIFKSKAAGNAIWIIFGKLCQAVLSLVISMITARYLGPSNYGLISYAASITSFAVPIMNLGFSNVLVRELTEHPEDEGAILGSSALLSCLSAVGCMVGIGCFTCIVDRYDTEAIIVTCLYSGILVFQALELIQYWFQAKLLSKYMSVISLCAYAATSVYKILLLVAGAKVYWFALANSIDYMLISAALFIVYKRLGGQKFTFCGDIAKRMFQKSRYFILSGLMIMAYAQTDKIMLKSMVGETSVGFYSAAVKCASITGFVFSAVIDSVRPVIFQYKSTANLNGYHRNLTRLYSIVLYGALIQSVVMTVFAGTIIGILYGNQYEAAAQILRVAVWSSTLAYAGGVRDIWILAENKQKYLLFLNASSALMNVMLNWFLIPRYEAFGAAAASLATQLFSQFAMGIIVWPLRGSVRILVESFDPRILLGTCFHNRAERY